MKRTVQDSLASINAALTLKNEAIKIHKPFAEPNHSLGYTESFLKQEMKSRHYKFEKFLEWMRGQTVGVDNNESIYYTEDVLRYVNMGGPRAKVID